MPNGKYDHYTDSQYCRYGYDRTDSQRGRYVYDHLADSQYSGNGYGQTGSQYVDMDI